MLTLKNRRSRAPLPLASMLVSFVLLGGGLYMLSLVTAPIVQPIIAMKPIDPAKLEEPSIGEKRIIIPKIGVDIEYGEGEVALDNGAQWRHPERGNPERGGNFILAAHRFTLAPTPQETVRKSPFYHIDKLVLGDEIIIDHEGKRYGYKINKKFDVRPTQIEIEAPSDDDKLTLYSCGLGGASDNRVVFLAEPLGEVDTKQLSHRN